MRLSAVVPFRVEVPESALMDLRERLARTRWPEHETVDGWEQGVPLDYLRDVCAYWRERYDWRRAQARLNAIPQYRTELDGLRIHFLHARSPHPDALPLLLTHGWPGSVLEFLDAIGPLVDPVAHGGEPRDAFHVVCPSLPGYGFSDKPAHRGWGVERIADAWARLMARLGYTRYAAQGGDWGAIVTMELALRHSERLAGIHLNMPLVDPAALRGLDDADEAERAALSALGEHRRWGAAYAAQQSTRPQTLGYALADSPAAQCAWILEKFQAWSDCDGHPENALTRDQLLDNVTLYWLTGTGASSARLYWESLRGREHRRVCVPAGCSIFPKEIFRVSRRLAESRLSDLRYYGEPDRGGHFAAFEQPELFVGELRRCFRVIGRPGASPEHVPASR